jgi:hypothetical protein
MAASRASDGYEHFGAGNRLSDHTAEPCAAVDHFVPSV